MNEKTKIVDGEELQYVDTWDLDTVEFEMCLAPWPLRWDASKKALTWATDPGYPAEETEGWNEILDYVRECILKRSQTHMQVEQVIYRAFPTDPVLAEKGVRIVKYHEAYIPKGSVR
jgi:hypothetical protein